MGLRLYYVIIQNDATQRTTSTLQHKCCVQFEFELRKSEKKIIPIFNQKIKGARYT